MSDTFKFPNGGYDVIVCRKQDIMDCLDANIIDKEVVLAVISQCEVDATNFLKEGRWTGIPFLGNMRVPKYKQKFAEIGGEEILQEAKQNLDEHRYMVFRKELNANIGADIKQERLYRYIISCFVTKHRRLYNSLIKDIRASKLKDPECFARFMCYSFTELDNYIPIEYCYGSC